MKFPLNNGQKSVYLNEIAVFKQNFIIAFLKKNVNFAG